MEEHGYIQVLKSAAGYYLGTLYYDEEMEGWFPNSRDTGYLSKEDATDLLESWNNSSAPAVYVWPDGDWCFEEDLEHYGYNKSDDFKLEPYDEEIHG